MSDTTSAQDLLVGELGSALSNARTEVTKQRTRAYTIDKLAADAMASTTTAATALPYRRVTYAGKVSGVVVHASAALTAHDTTNAVLTVQKLDAAGANAVTVATLTTNTTSGNWVAGTSKAFTLSTVADALTLVEGGSLTLAITKGSTGVVVPISTIEIKVVDQ